MRARLIAGVLAAVVLAGDGRARVVVERETYDDLVRKDVVL